MKFWGYLFLNQFKINPHKYALLYVFLLLKQLIPLFPILLILTLQKQKTKKRKRAFVDNYVAIQNPFDSEIFFPQKLNVDMSMEMRPISNPFARRIDSINKLISTFSTTVARRLNPTSRQNWVTRQAESRHPSPTRSLNQTRASVVL